MLLLQPVASLGLAAVVLSQRPTWLQLLGAVLILSGVLGVAIRATAVDVPDELAQSTAQPGP
jgi:drug/metabolite transporter (DMT)-like permease